MPMNILAKFFTRNLKTKLDEAEYEIHSDGANLFRGDLAVGGKLFLSNKRLIFLPHRFNFGFGGKDLFISLADIQSIKAVKTLDLYDNGLTLVLKDQSSFTFVLNNRLELIQKLEKAGIQRN